MGHHYVIMVNIQFIMVHNDSCCQSFFSGHSGATTNPGPSRYGSGRQRGGPRLRNARLKGQQVMGNRLYIYNIYI